MVRPMLSTSDLKKGAILLYEDAPCRVETVKVSVPTARGGNTITRVRMRNLRTKQKLDVSFRGGEMFPEPDFQRRPSQLLYVEKDMYFFMDQENFEQFGIHKDELEWELNFLTDNLEGIYALKSDEELLGIELPTTVALPIAETTPAIKGASATARTKPATLVTGHMIQVPEHISEGDVVNVDTRTGEFLRRA